MTDENQTNPEADLQSESSSEPESPVEDQTATDEKTDSSIQQSEDTANTEENQAEQLPIADLPLDQRMDRFFKLMSGNLSEKEIMKLVYVDQSIPEPYFDRWVTETNDLFRLVVRLKKRIEIQKRNSSVA